MSKKKIAEQKRLDERVCKIEEDHFPTYELVSTHVNLQKEIDYVNRDVWKVKERICRLEDNDLGKDKDNILKRLEVWKEEHDGDKRAILTHYGVELQLARLRTLIHNGSEKMRDEFDSNYDDRQKLRTIIDDSYKQCIQYVLSMLTIHENEFHAKITPNTKTNPKDVLKEKIKNLKATLKITLAGMQYSEPRHNIGKSNLEHVVSVLRDCLAVLVSVEEKFEKDMGDEKFDVDSTDYNKETDPNVLNLLKAKNIMQMRRGSGLSGGLSESTIGCICAALEYATTLI